MVKISNAKEEIKAMRERLSRNGLMRLSSFEDLLPRQMSSQTVGTRDSPKHEHHYQSTFDHSDREGKKKRSVPSKLSKLQFGNKLSTKKRSVIYASCDTLKPPHQQQADVENRMSQFKTEDEIKNLRSSLKQLNLLHTIGSYKIIQEFKYPSNMSQIIKFIKENDLDLFEKIRQTRNLFMKRFIDSGQPSVQQVNSKDKDFTRLFTMNERQQVVVLKEWLEHMIETFVKQEPQLGINRLNQEQLLITFTLSDLRDQLSIECKERGEIIDKVLALLFDMFACYESSFDQIIEDEVHTIEKHKKQQVSKKDELMLEKDRQLQAALDKISELQQVVEEQENKITALLVQGKAMDSRFTILRNLVENLAFTYRNKLDKNVTKEKGERSLIKNFVYQLKELKRFSTKDDAYFSNLDLLPQDEQQMADNLKRKVHKQTQTVFDYRKKLGALPKASSNMNNKLKSFHIKKHKKKNSSKDFRGVSPGEGNIMETEDSKYESPTMRSPTDNLRVDSENSLTDSSMVSSDARSIKKLSSLRLNTLASNTDTNRLHTSDDQMQQTNADDPYFTVDKVTIEEEMENGIQEENEEDNAENQQNDIFQIIEEYQPDQLLEMITYYQQHALAGNQDQQVQTDVMMTMKTIREPHQQQPSYSGSEAVLMKKQTFAGYMQEIGSQSMVLPVDSELVVNQNRVHIQPFELLSSNESGDENPNLELVVNQQKSLQLQAHHSIRSQPDFLSTPILTQNKVSSSNLRQFGNLQRQTTTIRQSPSMRPSTDTLTPNHNPNNPISNHPLSTFANISIEDMLEEISNLNLQDLDVLLSQDKQYNKKSMQFLSSLIKQLKRTNSFRVMVEKTAKDKIREEEKKERVKEELIQQKKGILKKNDSVTSLQTVSVGGGQEAGKNNNSAAIKLQDQKSKTQIMKDDKQLNVSTIKHVKTSHVIEERTSSESSRQSSRPEILSPNTPKKKKHYLTKESSLKSPSGKDNFGGSKRSAKKQQSTFSDKQTIPSTPLVRREDKGVQVDTISGEQVESMQRRTLMNLSQNSFEEQKTMVRSGSQPIGEGETTPKTSTFTSDFKSKLRQKILMVGKVSLAFQQASPDLKPKNSFSGINTGNTVPQPFNLGQGRITNKPKQTAHPMSKFLPTFIEKYRENDKKFLNVNPMSVKQVVKFIFSFYYDKAQGAKDSFYTRQQSLSEFMYDSLFNKYGIANITEKKLKEILLTIMLHKSTNVTIGLFYRFLGLAQDSYSNDDLAFLYKLNKRMVSGDSFLPVVRREINFESPHVIFNNAYEIFNQYFQKKLMPKTFQSLQEFLQQELKSVSMQTTQNGLILVPTEKYFEALIHCYQRIKSQIYQQIKPLINNDGESPLFDYPQCLSERLFDYEEFQKKIKQFNSRVQLSDIENLYQIFDSNKITNGVQSTQVKDEDKRISLEGLIWVIFKYDLLSI